MTKIAKLQLTTKHSTHSELMLDDSFFLLGGRKMRSKAYFENELAKISMRSMNHVHLNC